MFDVALLGKRTTRLLKVTPMQSPVFPPHPSILDNEARGCTKARCVDGLSRRDFVALGAAGAASLAMPTASAQAARYPAHPVRLIVSLPAGTSPDVIARLWAERFAKLTGQPVAVENRPGAGTILAAQAVASAPADGYTLLWTVNNTFSINPYLYRSLPYKADDFLPVTQILSVPFLLLVSGQSKFQTLADLVREAKRNPGSLTYASAGIGTAPHVIMAKLLHQAGITMMHVPYKESFVPDVMAQRVDAVFDATTIAIANLKSGRLRALGISSPARIALLKDIAPIAETFPGFTGESWHGIFAPRGTPPQTVSAIAEASQQVVDAADFRERLTDYGLIPINSSASAFRAFLADDARLWSQVIRTNNITAD